MSNLTIETKTKVFNLGVADGALPVPMYTCAAEDPQIVQMLSSNIIGTATYTDVLMEFANIWDNGYTTARATVYASVNHTEN